MRLRKTNDNRSVNTRSAHEHCVVYNGLVGPAGGSSNSGLNAAIAQVRDELAKQKISWDLEHTARSLGAAAANAHVQTMTHGMADDLLDGLIKLIAVITSPLVFPGLIYAVMAASRSRSSTHS